jgi:hypothetical protein
MKKIHTQSRSARTRRKLFPEDRRPWLGPTRPETVDGWRRHARKVISQFRYLGLSKPKFGEL